MPASKQNISPYILQYNHKIISVLCRTIDHNPSSNTAQDSFHGTAISLTQHTTIENGGNRRHQSRLLIKSSSKSIEQLPQSYSSVPPVASRDNSPPPQKEGDHQIRQLNNLIMILLNMFGWLK